MTDQPKPPAPEPKDAVPAGHFAKPHEAKKLSFGQQLGLWTLILIVGVVFGIGTPVSMLFGSGKQANLIGDISQTDVIPRLRTAEHLERILNPGGYPPKFLPADRDAAQQMIAEQLNVARIAESRGLMPKGQALDRIEADFLATPMSGSSGRTYHDALSEHENGAQQVKREDLRLYLQEQTAREGLVLRSAVPPAVPRDSGSDAYAVLAEQAETASVVLDGAKLMPAVKDDDPEIAAAYQALRGKRFQRPVSVKVTLAIADLDAFIKDIQVSDDEAKAWYDKHQDDYRDEKLGTQGKPVIKPFEQVKAEAVKAAAKDRAGGRAEALAGRFNDECDALDGEKDPAKFAEAAKKAGMRLEDQSIEDATPGSIALGSHGTLKDLIGLFGHEHDAGFVSRPAQTSSGAWVVIRLVSRQDAGFQELATVKPQVIRYLSGRRAWKKLLEQAGMIRDQIKKPGALAAWAASEDGKAWGAQLRTEPLPPTTTLATPPAEADGQPGEPLLVARLAMPERPAGIALVMEPSSPWMRTAPKAVPFIDDVPQVRLVQVSEIKAADATRIERQRLAEWYRESLGRYSESLLQREIRQQLEKR